MKRFACIFVVIALVLGGCSDGWERTKPVISPLTESVYATGNVKATDQYSVFPVVSGIVQRVMVKAGDTVKVGTPLFLLDDRTAGLNAQSARLALELSQQNSRNTFGRLREAELNVNTARAKYELDSIMYRRQQRLWEQKIGTRQEYELRQLTYTSSRSNYQAALTNLALHQTQIRNELQRARINYDISRRLEDDYMIRSSLNGKIYDVLQEEGELVTPQTQLAIIGRNNSFLLELQIDEDDIARVKVGQPLVVTLSSHPGQAFDGRIEKIYPIMDERSRTFRAEASFINPPPDLFPNLTVEANIIIRTKNKALLIPKNYVVDDNHVYIAKDRKQPVKTGLRDYRKVEILDGLDTTQYIYKPQ
ncbi:efflux RND transporter periplasmic adaptor subunit [Adhaeribacter rhizoryzae]|uniref:Efflux RND transporter periplasmic adaptor subunit n=1 Tax=Adhaeribacter rhizoryzae TaxID=2607907 RepID=A0A5M6CXI3_9BACT|nr:efflux RND transporter periplasmic adaptor subunit [Adhaeribacter rhizoryzae]KAA5539944.1 efflux RND transporter periplasmic adaptor subunit [Adhaeribacter rhizoryzae]